VPLHHQDFAYRRRKLLPSLAYYYDDFIGAYYDNRLWSYRGTSLSLPAYLAGSIFRLLADASTWQEIYQNGSGDWSVAKSVRFRSRFRLYNLSTTSRFELGLKAAAPDEATDWIRIHRDTLVSTRWYFETRAAGVATTVDSGTAAPAVANYYEIDIETKPGSVRFALTAENGFSVGATITTNIPSKILQPFAYTESKTAGSTRALYLDWLEIYGERE
jgi:hypothetical protein